MTDRVDPDLQNEMRVTVGPGTEATPIDPGAGEGVAASSLWWTATNVLPYLATTVVSIVAARTLGAHLMGQQSFIAFVTLLATEAGVAGMSVAIGQSVAAARGRGTPELIAPLARWALRFELGVGAIGAATLIAMGIAGATPRVAWALAGVTVMLGIAARAPSSVLIGLGRWKNLSITIVAIQTGGGAITVLTLLAGGGVTAIVTVRLATAAVFFPLTWLLARRALARVAFRPSESRELVRPTLHYAIGISGTTLVALLVSQRTEYLFLKGWSTETQIAFYAIAVSAVSALMALPQSIGVVLFPALSSLRGAGDDDAVRASYQEAVRLSLLVTIPLAGLAVAVGPALLSAIYGSAYDDARSVLILLLPTLVFAAVAAPSSAILIAGRKIKLPFLAASAGLIVDIAAAAALVPFFNADGAAIANTLAQGTAAIFLTGFAVSAAQGGRIGLRTPVRITVTATLATVAARLVLTSSNEAIWSIGVAIVVFVVTLPLVGLVLRPLEANDAHTLLSLGGARASRLRPLVTRLAGEPS